MACNRCQVILLGAKQQNISKDKKLGSTIKLVSEAPIRFSVDRICILVELNLCD